MNNKLPVFSLQRGKSVKNKRIMDIKQIISDYQNASGQDKKIIEEKLEHDFSLLPENKQKEIQRIFFESQSEAIQEAKEALEELKLYTELKQFSTTLYQLSGEIKDTARRISH